MGLKLNLVFTFCILFPVICMAEFEDSFQITLNYKDKTFSIEVITVPNIDYKPGSQNLRDFDAETFIFKPVLNADQSFNKSFDWILEDHQKYNIAIEIESRAPLQRGYAGFRRRSYLSIRVNHVLVFDSPIGGIYHLQAGDFFLNQIIVDKKFNLAMHAEYHSFFSKTKTIYFSDKTHIFSIAKNQKFISFIDLLAEFPEEKEIFEVMLKRTPPIRYIRPEFPSEAFKYFGISNNLESFDEVKKSVRKYIMKNGSSELTENYQQQIEHYISFELDIFDLMKGLYFSPKKPKNNIVSLFPQNSCKNLLLF